MGEVYRALDTTLGREVAIKVLPANVATDTQRLSRFRREAMMLASLNHPGIAAIHNFHEEAGQPFLVMELVEGLTLADRIAHAPLPVPEALAVARQMADALESAHEAGIVHRDLKPANVKLTPDGKVKILDFGLAKAWAGSDSQIDHGTAATLALDATGAGVILGTARYMAPEQARGRPVDKRADIWAFGVVLYEMLVGQALFGGETLSDVLAAVLTKQPDLDLLPAGTPARVRELLRRCLARDPRERLRDIGDARQEIQLALSGAEAAAATAPSAGVVASRPAWIRVAQLGGVAVLASGLTWLVTRDGPAAVGGDVHPVRFSITLPEGLSANRNLPIAEEPSVAVSRDGRAIAFVAGNAARSQIYRRALDEFENVPVEGTERGVGPFFSPDGNWLGFLANGQVQRVQLPGGTPQPLFADPSNAGGAGAGGVPDWSGTDTIYLSSGFFSPVVRRTIQGTTNEAVTTLDPAKSDAGHTCPSLLPGGKVLLFTARSENVSSFDDATIEVQRLDTGERKTLLVGGDCARYAPTGHLVYARSGTLMAIGFDLDRLEVRGTPTTVVDGVLTDPIVGAMHYGFSETGTLAYVVGTTWNPERMVVRVTRDGKPTPLLEGRSVADVAVAPDGRRVAMRFTAANDDLWLYDLERRSVTRVTIEGGDQQMPVWSPDGTRIAYGSVVRNEVGLFWKTADGGPAERLLKTAHQAFPGSFAPDGTLLAYTEIDPSTQGDIWVVPVTGDRTPRVIVNTRFHEWSPRISPDGRWLAYNSDESGHDEVYLHDLTAGGRRQVSTEGGTAPSWPRAGRELYFRNGTRMMAATFDPVTGVTSQPRQLFNAAAFTPDLAFTPRYDVLPDGQSFIVIHDVPRPLLGRIDVVLNWFSDLERLVPRSPRR